MRVALAGTLLLAGLAGPQGPTAPPAVAPAPAVATSPGAATEDATAEEQADSPASTALAGPASLAGRLIDEGGRPIAGATVLGATRGTLASELEPLPLGAPLVVDLATSPGTDTERGFALVARALTDADGRFALANLAPGRVRVELHADGFAPHTIADAGLASRGTSDLGWIVLEAGRSVSGSVVDARGEPARQALIGLLAPELGPEAGYASALPVATTRQDGTFALDHVPPGAWTIAVLARASPETTFAGRIDERASLPSLALVLPEGARIQGHVLSEPETGFAGVLVHALPAARLPLAPPARLTAEDRAGGLDAARRVRALRGARSVPVQADGSFEIDGLAAGEPYALCALPAGRDALVPDAWSGAALAYADGARVRLALARDAALELTVVDGSDAAPVERFAVHVLGVDPPRARRTLGELVHHAQGRARLDALRPLISRWEDGGEHGGREDGATQPELGAGELQLVVRAPGYEPWTSPTYALLPGGTFEVGRVRLARRPTLRVRVRDEHGAPLAGARVRLAVDEAGDSGGAGELCEARTDADGLARIDDRPLAPRRLAVVADGYAPRVLASPFALHPGPDGESELALELDRGGALDVLVLDAEGEPVPALPVRHLAALELDGTDDGDLLGIDDHGHDGDPGYGDGRGSDARRGATTDARGVARIEGLPDGPRVLAVGRSGLLEAHEVGEIVVRRGARGELRLTTDGFARVRGSVVLGDAPLPGAALAWRMLDASASQRAQHGWAHVPAAPFALRADARGRFELERVEVGTWTVEVRHAGATRPALLTVSIGPGARELTLDPGAAPLRLRVVDASGAPARVPLFVQDDAALAPPAIEPGANVFALAREILPAGASDADGWAVLHGVPAGALVLALDPRDGASASYVLGTAHELIPPTLVLAPPARLALERERWPAAGERALVLVPEQGSGALAARVIHPWRGDEIFLDGLVPGRWLAWRVALDRSGRARSAELAAEIDLVAGERTSGAWPR